MSFSSPNPDPQAPRVRRRFLVSGRVQGVGFRPFVFNLARSLGLTGCVGNDTSGVFVEVQGPAEAVAAFLTELSEGVPAPGAVEAVRIEELPPREETEFIIAASAERPGGGLVIPPDIATCADCYADLHDL